MDQVSLNYICIYYIVTLVFRYESWLSLPPQRRRIHMISVLERLFKPAPLDTGCVVQPLARQAPKVSTQHAQKWARNATRAGASYMIVVHMHNLYDPSDFDEIFWEGFVKRRHVLQRLRHYDEQYDATALQVIDLAQDIDEQFAKATYIERS